MKVKLLLLLGLALGLAGGLLFAWVIAPIRYYDTYPPLLQTPYRHDWIRMTALTYGEEGHWERTQLRLSDLAEAEIRQVIAQTLEDAIDAGQPIIVLQRIAQLARSYGVDNVSVRIYTRDVPPTATPGLPATATATATALPATPTATPPIILSTPTPTATRPTLPYTIISQTLACAPQPQIGISLQLSQTITERGHTRVQQTPLPDVAIWLLHEAGADRAITGFHPAQGQGYADFVVLPGVQYNLYIETPTGAPIATLQIGPCTPEEGGGWLTHTLIVQREPPAE